MKPSIALPVRLFERIRIVLVSTSHPGNIGAAARALKTMGLARLVLVEPRFADALSHPDALAFAVGAADVLERAQVCETLTEALADCHWAVAMSARGRDISLPEIDPRGAAAKAIDLVASSGGESRQIAFVFGSERYGLDNEDVMKCQAVCAVPTDPGFSSLNLAQAVQIVAYECRLAALASTAGAGPMPENSGGKSAAQAAPATIEEHEQFYEHLQRALIALDFLNAEHPKKLMHRLRRLFARAGLEHEEVNILRGICTAILTPQRKQ